MMAIENQMIGLE